MRAWFTTQRRRVCIRMALSIGGTLLSLAILETFFWVFSLLYTQHVYPTNISPTDLTRYRIVALGESTTAWIHGPAWPELLEQELNRRAGAPRFRVYNLGVGGADTTAILGRLIDAAMKFQPNMVITMMGINDVESFNSVSRESTGINKLIESIKGLRVSKFLGILVRIITHKTDRNLIGQATRCSWNDGIGKGGWWDKYWSQFSTMYQEAATFSGNNKSLNKVADKTLIEPVLLSYVEKYPFSYSAYDALVKYYVTTTQWEKAASFAKYALALEPFMKLCVALDVTILQEQKVRIEKDIMDAETAIEASYHLALVNVVEQKSVLYKKEGLYDDQRNILGEEDNTLITETVRNYLALSTYLHAHGMQHVAMQYPLIPIRGLQQMLAQAPWIIYVSNEENFQMALKNYPYAAIFTDNFGGVFGHTTQLGYQLIASAAADAVLQIVSTESIEPAGK